MVMDKEKPGGLKLFTGILLLIVTGVVIFLLTRTDFASTAKIVPPTPVFADCSEIESEIKKYNWDAELAFAIAKAESQCNANAYGDEDLVYQKDNRNYGYSVGVFQVRILPGREDCDSYDIQKNVACAYDVYSEKNDFSPWSGYSTGKYKRYFWRTLEEL